MTSVGLKTKALALATLLFVALAAAPAWASDWPKGPHENLNIIGGPSCGNVPSGAGGGNRGTIFVPLTTNGDSPNTIEPESSTFDATDTSIYLIQGPAFAVCNGDACTQAVDCSSPPAPLGKGTKNGAVFQLPCDVIAPAGTITTCTAGSTNSALYCIYAAAAGSPKGTPEASITTCAVDTATNTEVCSTNNAVLMRNKGGPVVQDVTFALTTITTTCVVGAVDCPCTGTTGVSTTCTFEIFNSAFQLFLWDYDNAGLKNAKLRFYYEPAGTTSCPAP